MEATFNLCAVVPSVASEWSTMRDLYSWMPNPDGSI